MVELRQPQDDDFAWDYKSEQEKIDTALVRSQSRFLNVIQELEDELKRMKEKQIDARFISTKDLQIDNLARFYNEVDDFFRFYKLELLNTRLKVLILNNMLQKQFKNVDDFLKYKPTTEELKKTNG